MYLWYGVRTTDRETPTAPLTVQATRYEDHNAVHMGREAVQTRRSSAH